MVRKLLSFLVIAALLMTVTNATSYTVGDSNGWRLGVNYTAWASGNTFKVGDELVFVYTSNHEVHHVTKINYDSCNASSPLSSDNSGHSSFIFGKVATRYFICGTKGHCEKGMKFQIDVMGSPPPPSSNSAYKFSSACSYVLGISLMMLAAI